MANQEISVKLSLDSNLEREMKKASRAVKRGSENIKQSTEKAGMGFKGLATAAASFYGATKLISFFKENIKLADTQAKAQALLDNALGRSTKGLQIYASQLQKITLFGDEETIAAAARLAAYIKEENQIKKLLPLIQDFATAKGMDLAGAAELVGKSLGSSTNALTRYGVEITGAVGSTERFNSAMKGLENQVGGAAEAAAKAGAGPLIQFQNALGDVREELGFMVLNSESFTDVIGMMTSALDYIVPVFKGVETVINGIVLGLETLVLGWTLTVESILKGIDLLPKALIPKSWEIGLDNAIKNVEDFRKLTVDTMFATADDIENIWKNKPVENITSGIGGEDKEQGKNVSGPNLTPQINSELLKEKADQYKSWYDNLNEYAINATEERNRAILDLELQAIEERRAFENEVSQEKKKLAEETKEFEEAKAQASVHAISSMVGAVGDLLAIAGKENEEAAKAAQAVAIVESVINTALAASKANTATPYPPVNAALMAVAIAQGVVQTALIASQSFATGGIVAGSSYNGDNVPIMANSGERVLTRSDQLALDNALKTGEFGGGSSIHMGDIIINGNADEATVEGIRQTKEEQLESLRSMIYELSATGNLQMAA